MTQTSDKTADKPPEKKTISIEIVDPKAEKKPEKKLEETKDAKGNGKDEKKAEPKVEPKVAPVVDGPRIGDVFELKLTDINVKAGENPRQSFDREKLNSLATSLKVTGLLSPLVIYRDDADGKYYLVAGERRLRASKIAGFAKVQCKLIANEMVQVRIARATENLQREDLNPMEVADCLKSILGLTVTRGGKKEVINNKNVAAEFGRSEGWASQYLKLLTLPQEIQDGVRARKITFVMARELYTINSPEKQLEQYRAFLKKEVTTRDVKRTAEKERHEQDAKKRKKGDKPLGRPARTESDVGDLSKASEAEEVREALRVSKMDVRKQTELKEGIATAWERFKRARSDTAENYWKGYMAGLEYASGLRKEL